MEIALTGHISSQRKQRIQFLYAICAFFALHDDCFWGTAFRIFMVPDPSLKTDQGLEVKKCHRHAFDRFLQKCWAVKARLLLPSIL